MTFKSIGRIKIMLSVSSLGILFHAPLFAQQPTAQACAALTLDSQRLACYDAIFKQQDPSLPSQDEHGEWFVADQTNSKSATSLLDQRWELSPETKLGTWHIRPYQPVYFLPAVWTSNKNQQPTSPNPANRLQEPKEEDSIELKYQLSLKTKALENIFGDNGDLWFAYTQSSRWQAYNGQDSSPFRETNYEPEASLVFRTNYDVFGLEGRLLGFTFNHQSNGQADPLSRSWNRLILNVGLGRDNFVLMLRPWYRIPEASKTDDNPDITDYIGRGDLLAYYQWQQHKFSLMLRHTLKTGDESRGAMRFDWSIPLKKGLYGHVQLFHGYGESLIDYNHKATYIGLGLSFLNWF